MPGLWRVVSWHAARLSDTHRHGDTACTSYITHTSTALPPPAHFLPSPPCPRRDNVPGYNPASSITIKHECNPRTAPAACQVVLSTAGPFARYGDNVVAQAVEQGTHYADITGEGNKHTTLFASIPVCTGQTKHTKGDGGWPDRSRPCGSQALSPWLGGGPRAWPCTYGTARLSPTFITHSQVRSRG